MERWLWSYEKKSLTLMRLYSPRMSYRVFDLELAQGNIILKITHTHTHTNKNSHNILRLINVIVFCIVFNLQQCLDQYVHCYRMDRSPSLDHYVVGESISMYNRYRTHWKYRTFNSIGSIHGSPRLAIHRAINCR